MTNTVALWNRFYEWFILQRGPEVTTHLPNWPCASVCVYHVLHTVHHGMWCAHTLTTLPHTTFKFHSTSQHTVHIQIHISTR